MESLVSMSLKSAIWRVIRKRMHINRKHSLPNLIQSYKFLIKGGRLGNVGGEIHIFNGLEDINRRIACRFLSRVLFSVKEPDGSCYSSFHQEYGLWESGSVHSLYLMKKVYLAQSNN